MAMYRVDDAQVRDAVSGELRQDLVGQPVKIVTRDTTTAFPIYDNVGDPVVDSVLNVTTVFTAPRFWVNDEDAPGGDLAGLYLDWLDENSGARGPVNFDAVLRAYAAAAAAASTAAATSAAAAQAAAEDAAETAGTATLARGGNEGQMPIKASGADGDWTYIDAPSGGTGGVVSWANVTGRPTTYPPDAHAHAFTELTGTSQIGRDLAKASTPQAARQAIGAGEPVPSSSLFPGFGTVAGTAAQGNHAHAQYMDSGQVDSAIDAKLAASGGGGGGGSVLVWKYASGAYPTLPASKPAGVTLVDSMGPVQPSTIPSWVGNGASQVPLRYTYNGGLS